MKRFALVLVGMLLLASCQLDDDQVYDYNTSYYNPYGYGSSQYNDYYFLHYGVPNTVYRSQCYCGGVQNKAPAVSAPKVNNNAPAAPKVNISKTK